MYKYTHNLFPYSFLYPQIIHSNLHTKKKSNIFIKQKVNEFARILFRPITINYI